MSGVLGRFTAAGPMLLIVAISLLVFARALFGDFISDDLAFAVDNAVHLGDPTRIPSFFTTGVWNHANEPSADASLYRPVWLLWAMLLHHLADTSSVGWHLGNLLLHAANGVLLYLVITRIAPNTSVAARVTGALLFAVHPATAQSVAWVSGSTDALLTLWVLTTLLAWWRFLDRPTATRYALTLGAAALAMLTKETGLVVLPLLLLIDHGVAGGWRAMAWRAHAGFAALVVGYLLARAMALQGVLDGTSPWTLDNQGGLRLLDYAAKYLATLVLPWPLPITFRNVTNVAQPWDYPVALLLLVALTVTWWRRTGLRPAIALILLPVAIPLLMALHDKGLFATRFLYLPAAGIGVLAVPLIAGLTRIRWRWAAVGAVGVVLAVLSVIHVGDWLDEYRWGRMLVRFDPGGPHGWTAQGRYLEAAGRSDELIDHYRQAIARVEPLDGRMTLTESLALQLAGRRRFDESLAVYRGIAAEAGFEALGWTGVGNNLWMLGDRQAAADAYHRAIDADPNHFEALFNLGLVSEQRGDLDSAAAAYRRLIRLPPAANQQQAYQRARLFLRRRDSRQDGDSR